MGLLSQTTQNAYHWIFKSGKSNKLQTIQWKNTSMFIILTSSGAEATSVGGSAVAYRKMTPPTLGPSKIKPSGQLKK